MSVSALFLCFLNCPHIAFAHCLFLLLSIFSFSFLSPSCSEEALFSFLQGNGSQWWVLFHFPPSDPLVHHTSSPQHPPPTPPSSSIPNTSIDRVVKIRSVQGNTQAVTTVLLSWQQDALGRGDHYSAHPFRSVFSGLSASWGVVGGEEG